MKTQKKRGRNWEDLTGKRFGSLVAIERVASVAGKACWRAKCDCGSITVKRAQHLKNSKFCGATCPNSEKHRYDIHATHRMTDHPAYQVWFQMKARCLKPSNKSYHNYGGRGISVCASWLLSFENFWADMGATWKLGLHIDRTNNDGNYEPSNCRWVTPRENARNKRTCVIPVWMYEELAKHGVKLATFRRRLRLGWTLEEARTTPIRKSCRYYTAKRHDRQL